jgi:protein TonB
VTSALNPSLRSAGDFAPVRDALAKGISNVSVRFDSFKFNQLLRNEEKLSGFSRKEYIILVLLVIAAHFAGVEGYLRSLNTPTIIKPEKVEVEVQLIKPVVVPPQEIEPPKPAPPPPKVEVKPQPSRPAPALHTAPAEQNITPDDLNVPENTNAPKTSEPVAAAPSPPPAPLQNEEPVTEASGYAGYLSNPPPEYPAFAQRQGWEGKVILHVHVQANGKASSVDVKQGSGRKALDDAALEVVKTWTFAPAKRGNTPIDGWATVPIEFKLSK